MFEVRLQELCNLTWSGGLDDERCPEFIRELYLDSGYCSWEASSRYFEGWK